MASNASSLPQGRPVRYQSTVRRDESPPCSPRAQPIHQAAGASSFSSMPLAIRGAPVDLAPPPLAPPRNVPIDRAPAETWIAKTAPKVHGSVRPGSSLHGNWSSPTQHRKRFSGHKSSLSQSESVLPPSPLRDMNLTREIKQEDGNLPPLPPIVAGRQLETHNHQVSTQSYDRSLITKLNRPKTPVRSSTLSSIDTSPVNGGKQLRVDTHPVHKLSLVDRSICANPDSPLKPSSPFGTKWHPIPQSGTISPSMISSTASTRSFSLAELRSPQSSYEPSTAPSSLSAEQMTFSRIGSLDRASNEGPPYVYPPFEHDMEREKGRYGLGRGPPDWGRSSRESFDHSIFLGDDPDSEFSAQAPASFRSRYADARGHRHSLPFEASLPDMGGPQGIKRKASPSLGDSVADEPPPQVSRSHTPGRTTKRSSPPQAHSARLSYGSQSGTNVQTSSYTPSHLSLAPSSATSYGTPEHPSLSAGVSSVSEATDSRHHPQSSYSAGLDAPVTQASQHRTGSQSSLSSVLHKEAAAAKPGRDGGIVATHIHVCDCCPKKPKKFNTLEELQTHQREKQFYCTYCHNRFKNKNEAERHQNSLHLRKQSWSCAALDNKIDRAFHACTATPSTSPTQVRSPNTPPAEFDVCGYCGKQFPNYPAADWIERQKHLSEVHKFGECNQAKKFFRADHFRQHLKHSHQGQSGKWTNMLEQACLREESPEVIPDSLRQPQQQATTLSSSYPAETLQFEKSASAIIPNTMPARAGQYTSAIGSHVQYEPKIDEEDEARV